MSAFQSAINATLALGVPGEMRDDGPVRSKVWELYSNGTPNIVGATAFTLYSTTSEAELAAGIAQAGGTGTFVGLLVNPKAYATSGGSTGTLSPTLTLPDYSLGELATVGAFYATLPAACNIGDMVIYNTTTGALATSPGNASITASQSTTTLTVTAVPSGYLGLNVGSIVTQASGQQSIIRALGTGVGGVGTYTVDTSQTVASGAATVNNAADNIAPIGFAAIPNAVVYEYAPNAAGVGVIKL